jgi:hypothetical protein
MRPRLALLVSLDMDAVREHFRSTIDSGACEGMISRHQVELIPNDWKLWSPQLAINIRSVEPGQTLVLGRFGPHPHLWGLIVALYASCAFSALGGLMLGWSQHLVGTPPTGFWLLLLSGVFAAAAYGSSFVGQRLGGEQMHALHDLVQASFEEKFIQLHRPEQDQLDALTSR